MEEKLLEAPFQSSNEQFKDLIVFRRSGNDFRLLAKPSLNSSGGGSVIYHEGTDKVINIHSVQIIPRYALQLSGRPYACDFELCFPGASSGDLYRFLNPDDRYAFQQALLGYKAVFEDSCDWLLHRKLKGAIGGTGLVQIFQAKPIQPSNPFQTSNDPGSTLYRPNSVVSHASTLTLGSQASTRTHMGSIIAEHPHAPLIVIFTKINGQLTFMRMALTHDVHVHPEYCDCGSNDTSKMEDCHLTFLQGSSKSPAHIFSTPIESKWNLAMLCLPKHPEFEKEMESVKHINYLRVKTSRPASAFQKALKKIMDIRDRELREFENGHRLARADLERTRPGRSSSMAASVASSETVLSDSTITSNTLPELESPLVPLPELESLPGNIFELADTSSSFTRFELAYTPATIPELADTSSPETPYEPVFDTSYIPMAPAREAVERLRPDGQINHQLAGRGRKQKKRKFFGF